MYAYHQQWSLPLALGAGFAAAFLLLLYATGVNLRMRRHETVYRFRTLRRKALGVLVVLDLFQGYVLLVPNPAHVKTAEVPSTPSCPRSCG